MTSMPFLALSNGVEMPALSVGLAFWFTEPGTVQHNPKFTGFLPEQCYRSVQLALEAGHRAFDTALVYRTHRHLGHVLGDWFTQGKLQKRSDIWIATKVYQPPSVPQFGLSDTVVDMAHLSPEQITELVMRHVERSIQDLGVGYLDLMILHWPAVPDSLADAAMNRKRRLAAWKVLEDFYDKGWLRAIGVSNFTEIHLQQLQDDGARIAPMVNQIEASVYVQWDAIVAYCRAHKIQVQAYSPLGHGAANIVNDPVVCELASKYKKDAGQIAIKYLIEKGYGVVFSSSSEKRLQSNQNIFDFELAVDDMKRLDALNRTSESTGQPSLYNMG